ncbi:oxidoreductase [Cucurbitaria berberidis CBS 394.84]|uniref:Oxidoreductase n=1 Tax=Cucurbitaria berberidis CBS 394.84 TaxID=1168544 RepID=A0A9P4GMC6_9PLEO|nr:oxidoreductase [Cucurbitaria berberidis CBS 394.84]KAF1849043.1 oxidoreductase [Cucurbitaria berberidis CBS 394.84]
MPSKSVLITGCSAGGIGHALALAFQERGLTVFATARSLNKMQDLASLPNIHLLSLDVTDPVSISTAVKEVGVRTGGRLDILVNNAGQQFVMPALDVNIEKAKGLFDVNYWAALRMIQEFAQMLIAARGVVVNVGSTAGVVTVPFQSQYHASKAAIIMLSEILRLELAPLNVRVITLMVGNVASNIDVNGPPPASLPSTSMYLPIEKQIAADYTWDTMPTKKFASQVVADVMSGKSGKVWRGGNTAIIRWAVPFMPQWVFDKIMISISRGLDKMPMIA